MRPDRVDVDGDLVKGDSRRAGARFSVNEAMLGNGDARGDMPLIDGSGGATVFLDSRVRIEEI